jgi:hypothetical protein
MARYSIRTINRMQEALQFLVWMDGGRQKFG